MIVIKWYGAFKVENDKVVDEFIFPEDDRARILHRIKKGDFSEVFNALGEDDVEIQGEIWDLNSLVKTTIELARIEMRVNIPKDYTLVETLNTYDDAVSILNLMEERLAEWERLRNITGKDELMEEKLRESIKEIEKLKDNASKEIERMSKEVCPNLSALVGPIIAARLIASAGGLHRLAKLPASTIQVLGAEEAFFRHLKSGAKCPKHGIIFRVPWVRNSPRKLRGKVARALAGKIAIAARVDYYGGDFIGDRLKEEMEKRVEEIRNDSDRKGR